jgi:hypothetical protein
MKRITDFWLVFGVVGPLATGHDVGGEQHGNENDKYQLQFDLVSLAGDFAHISMV